MTSTPRVFLSYASEDRSTAERLARDMTAAGIQVFFAEWEIRPGDSIRAKIDQGLAGCTHFVVLLTPASIGKPWVNAEIDGAFVLKVEQSCRFIPLRMDLPATALPPLLRGLNSPSLDDYDRDLRSLLGHLFDLAVKPLVGPLRPVFALPPAALGVSTAAARLLEIFVRESANGRRCDPQLSPAALQAKTELTTDELEIAVDELEQLGIVHVKRGIGTGTLGFQICANARLFSDFDQYFMPWSPSQDARVIVATLVNSGRTTVRADAIAAELGWEPRRANPAITYLLDNRLVTRSEELTPIFVTVQFWLETRARRWLKES